MNFAPIDHYRNRTLATLRRYSRISTECGRLPSLLGREFFHSYVSHQSRSTFEDTVIYKHDMERCLDQLQALHRHLLARIVFEEFSVEEVAAHMACTPRTVLRQFYEALDRLSRILLDRKLMSPLPSPSRGLRQRRQPQPEPSVSFPIQDGFPISGENSGPLPSDKNCCQYVQASQFAATN